MEPDPPGRSERLEPLEPLERLERLLRARSLAVVGASGREGSFGQILLDAVLGADYEGAVFPVNPGYDALRGLPCYPAPVDLPEPPDCALLAVADERLEAALRDVAAAGVPAAVVFGGAHGLAADGRTPLAARLAEIAREAGMALCGGNAMGFLNLGDRLYATGYPYRGDPAPGRVAFLSHSGSTFSAVVNNRRGLRFNYVVSSGQELVTTAADYLRFFLAQPETRAIGGFLETVRDPAGFVAALAVANAREVPVVVLKVGRSERGRWLTEAHSGAIAGADGAYEAAFDRYGAIRVRSLDELLDTLELLAAPRRPRATGLALATDSGGERGLIGDLAADLGIEWAALRPATVETLRGALEPELAPVNPLDLWGTGRDFAQVYETCLTALANDPAVGLLLFAVDLTPRSRLLEPYLGIAERVAAASETPFAVLANVAATADETAQARLRAAGIPVLLGTDHGLAAAAHLLAYGRRRPAAPGDNLSPGPASEIRARWQTRLKTVRGPLDEIESKELLAAWGVPVVAERLVTSMRGAVAAAVGLGFPVVLKTAQRGLGHKSDRGGVILDLPSRVAVRAAYIRLQRELGRRVVVQAQVPAKGSVELLLGMINDPQWGPLVTVGLGGVFVEVLGDAVSFLPPVTASEALAYLRRLRAFPLLTGARGRPPVDLAAATAAISRFSLLCREIGPALGALDVNPLLVGPWGAVAVDALAIPLPLPSG
jgi:acyl-CoA synthetase (NDP forming)